MKRKLLLILLAIVSANCYSQISFEKGYYINNSGQKVDCLIKNNDWIYNPAEFQYKLSTTDEPKVISVKMVKEFEIYNSVKYLRRKVKADISNEYVSNLNSTKRAILSDEDLLLRVLVEGNANLYSYADGNIKKFFFKSDSSHIKQLVFKKYLISESEIGENNRYKQQLWVDLKCEDITFKAIQNLDYDKNKLITFFVKYNECKKSEFKVFEAKKKRDLFNLAIRPGLSLSSLGLHYENQEYDKQSSILGFRLGVEVELVMPFNKNKWSFIIEPVYQSFKYDKDVYGQNMNVESKSINLPIGIRYYFFINDKSKIFINGSYGMGISFNSKIDFENSDDLDIKTENNFSFGMGYNYSTKYSLELRYSPTKDIIDDSNIWSANYSSFSLIFGYSLF